MYLIVGLGNPGAKYEYTYHNLGFLAIDRLAAKIGAEFTKERNSARVARALANGNKILLIKPKTYMNLSYQSIMAFIRKEHVSIENLIVLCDDIDIEKGKIRYKEKGSGGTHNGLRGIVSALGKNFKRIRIGSKPLVKVDVLKYVLENIPKEDMLIISGAIDEAVSKALELVGWKQENLD